MSDILRTASRKPLLLTAALGGSVLLTLFLLSILGSEQGVQAASAQETATRTATAPESTRVEAVAESLPILTYDVYLDRDPFEPVLEVAEATPDSTPAEEQPAPGATTGRIVVDETGQLIVVQEPITPIPGTTEPPPAGTPPYTGSCSGEDEVVCDGRVVTLHEVRSGSDGQVAVIQVDETTYEVGVGEVFATSFRLLSIAEQCATFLYGDDPTTICAGQRTMK